MGVIGVRGVIGPFGPTENNPADMSAEEGVAGSIEVLFAPETDLGCALSDEEWAGVAPELCSLGAGDGAAKLALS